nr:hypothetical protein [uncultured bacterium]
MNNHEPWISLAELPVVPILLATLRGYWVALAVATVPFLSSLLSRRRLPDCSRARLTADWPALALMVWGLKASQFTFAPYTHHVYEISEFLAIFVSLAVLGCVFVLQHNFRSQDCVAPRMFPSGFVVCVILVDMVLWLVFVSVFGLG